jgi:hypothetical protein
MELSNEAEGGVRASIKGITTNWGLLKAEELRWEYRPTGKMWELQSDSNSFDFFRGLLKRKFRYRMRFVMDDSRSNADLPNP